MSEKREITRRRMLGTSGGIAAAVALGVPGSLTGAESSSSQAPPQPARSGGKPRTLALIGDRWHSSDYIRVSLDRVFRDLDLPIDYTINYAELSSRLLEPYQLFIGFRDNMAWPHGYPDPGRDPYHVLGNGRGRPADWITEEQGEAVKQFVAAGNGFYSLHNNVFVSLSSRNYREVQGGVALGHPPVRPFKVHVANPSHPVTRGVRDFMVTDEQHYTVYDLDPKNILLRGENLDGLDFDRRAPGSEGGKPKVKNLGKVSISGWAHEYGRGRVVFTAIGHTIHAMWQPEYLKLQKNAVHWLLKRS